MSRIATIRIQRETSASMTEMGERFVQAFKSGSYQGEVFSFESPAALFRQITPKRWELIEKLQSAGSLGVRALARALERDVKRVHDDAKALLELGIIEKTKEGKLVVPFEQIHADFVLKAVA